MHSLCLVSCVSGLDGILMDSSEDILLSFVSQFHAIFNLIPDFVWCGGCKLRVTGLHIDLICILVFVSASYGSLMHS